MNPGVLRIVPNTPLFSLLVLLQRMFYESKPAPCHKKKVAPTGHLYINRMKLFLSKF
jgi:hypothetical protein